MLELPARAPRDGTAFLLFTAASTFSLTLLQVKYFIRRISSEQRFYFPSKNWTGKIVFIVFFKKNIEAVKEAGGNFRV